MLYQHIAKCENNKCKNKNECIRFKNAKAAIIDFEYLCNEDTNYKWFWKIKSEIIKK